MPAEPDALVPGVGLEKHRGRTLHPAAPAALAGMLAAGEVDIALVSIIDALRPMSGRVLR